MRSVTIPYRQENHGDFDAEWPLQRDVSGWWYITGYFTEEGKPEKLYSYQFTVIRPKVLFITPWILQLAITDVSTGKHHFTQRMKLSDPEVYVTEDSVHYLDFAHLKREADHMHLVVNAETFDLDMVLDKGKGATWHADDGVLVMGGAQDPKRRTVYYSYTNMPSRGKVVLRDPQGQKRTMQVTGKSWFDRQWGPYELIKANTHWEWFSLRFFDDEEVMLFAFPQCNYFDGTFVGKNKERKLVRDYTLTPKGYTGAAGMQFTKGWEFFMPGIKEEKYEIRPLTDGQLNLAYFELIAAIINPAGEQVGLCMVELLPGARNPQSKINPLNMFKKV